MTTTAIPVTIGTKPTRLPEVRTLEHMRIAVSYFCNLRCQHCYVPELNRVKYRSLLEASQLSLDEIREFIDLLVDELGLQKVTITGGEALLNVVWPRTSAVLGYALSKGLTVQLNTSGSGQVSIYDVAAQCNGNLDKLILHLSLDGIDEEKVDKFRGKKGAMRKALKTHEEASELGIRVEARMTMTDENYMETVDTYDVVSDLGAYSFNVKPMFMAGTARDNEPLLIRSREQVAGVQRDLLDRSVGRTTKLGLPEPVYVAESEFPEGANAFVIKCACGSGAGYLSTNGDVYPCSYLVGAPGTSKWVLGNIRDPEFDFVKTWREPTTYIQFREAPPDENCTAQNVVGEDYGLDLGPGTSQCV